jgi:iron complex transport system permease protein
VAGPGLLLLSLLTLALGASVGSTGFDSLLNAQHDPVAWQIVWDIRLPRTLGAWLAGALLGLSGAVAQGLFRNPLADPFLLGSASGAALAVALAFAALGVSGMVAGSSGAALAAGGLARAGAPGADRRGLRRRAGRRAADPGAGAGRAADPAPAAGGVVVGYVLGAVRELVQLAQPDVLQAMQGFTLGITGFVGWSACAVMAAVLLPLLPAAWAAGARAGRAEPGRGHRAKPGPAAGAPCARC